MVGSLSKRGSQLQNCSNTYLDRELIAFKVHHIVSKHYIGYFKDKRSSLFRFRLSDEEKKFYIGDARLSTNSQVQLILEVSSILYLRTPTEREVSVQLTSLLSCFVKKRKNILIVLNSSSS
jgi:hypothetical protein